MRWPCIPQKHNMGPWEHLPCKNTSTAVMDVIRITIISGISRNDSLESGRLQCSYLESIKSTPALSIHAWNKQCYMCVLDRPVELWFNRPDLALPPTKFKSLFLPVLNYAPPNLVPRVSHLYAWGLPQALRWETLGTRLAPPPPIINWKWHVARPSKFIGKRNLFSN